MVQSKLKTMVYISLLVAQALVIGLIENMIPYPISLRLSLFLLYPNAKQSH